MLQPDLQRIAHIREYCVNIQEYRLRFGTTFEEFKADLAYQQSVSFCILQIGELCGGLSEEYRRRTKAQVQWAAMKGMRNVVVRDYGNIKLELVWNTITNDIPSLQKFCEEQLVEAE